MYVVAKPNINEQYRLASAKVSRIRQRRDLLGVAGLRAQESVLTATVARNNHTIPPALLAKVPLQKPANSERFRQLKTWATGERPGPEGFDLDALPCHAVAYNVRDDSITVSQKDISKICSQFHIFMLATVENLRYSSPSAPPDSTTKIAHCCYFCSQCFR